MNPYYESDNVKLYNADCLEVMPQFEAQSFDAILTDVPYGITACSWDVVIPFPDMWKVVKHVLKKKGAFVTTASQPFTSKLVCSNLEWFKYEVIFRKSKATGFLDANRKPLKCHENIIVFFSEQGIYNPQMIKGKLHRNGGKNRGRAHEQMHGKFTDFITFSEAYYPQSVIDFTHENDIDHPTQKPEALYRYLALTYTNPENTVLDFCMGSGTTGVACVQTGRKFVGIEISKDYCDISVKRIKDAEQQMRLF